MSTLPTPEQVAVKLCDTIPPAWITYAGSPERHESRGFAALFDHDDGNQLALNAGCPGPDGTQERLDLITTYIDAISAEIIDRYVKAHVLTQRK